MRASKVGSTAGAVTPPILTRDAAGPAWSGEVGTACAARCGRRSRDGAQADVRVVLERVQDRALGLGERPRRRVGRLGQRLGQRAEGAGDDVEAAAVARDLADKLLARLSPEDRLVLVMLDVEGLSTAEIAEVTGWSVSKVKVRAHRARAHLRRVLKRFV